VNGSDRKGKERVADMLRQIPMTMMVATSLLLLASCGRKAELKSACGEAVAAARKVYVERKEKFPLDEESVEQVCECGAQSAVKAGKEDPKVVDAILAYWQEFARKPGKFEDMRESLEGRFGTGAVGQAWTLSMNALLMGPVNVCQGIEL